MHLNSLTGNHHVRKIQNRSGSINRFFFDSTFKEGVERSYPWSVLWQSQPLEPSNCPASSLSTGRARENSQELPEIFNVKAIYKAWFGPKGASLLKAQNYPILN